MADDKGDLAPVLGLGKKKKPGPLGGMDDAMGGDMGGSAKTDAAQGIIDAVKSGDASALSDALSTHYDLCSSSASEEPDDEDEYAED